MENPKIFSSGVVIAFVGEQDGGMTTTPRVPDAEAATIEIKPLIEERMEDFAAVVNPNKREKHCWC